MNKDHYRGVASFISNADQYAHNTLAALMLWVTRATGKKPTILYKPAQ